MTSLTDKAVAKVRAKHPDWFPLHKFVVEMRTEPDISVPPSFADAQQAFWCRFIDQHDVRRKGGEVHHSFFAAKVTFGSQVNIGVYIETNMLLIGDKKTFVFAHVYRGGREQDLAHQKYVARVNLSDDGTDRGCDNPRCLTAGKDVKLKACPCNLVKYCTKMCQEQHWSAHKVAHRAALQAKRNVE